MERRAERRANLPSGLSQGVDAVCRSPQLLCSPLLSSVALRQETKLSSANGGSHR